MLRVPTHHARAGMVLALEVLHPRTGQRLLSQGFELDQHLVRKLIELQVHEVWIEYPQAADIRKYISPVVCQHHTQMVGMIAEIFAHLHSGAYANLDFPRYRQTLRDLIEALVGQPTAASYIIELGGESSNELRHASEVCFLSILLGLKLQGYLISQRKRLAPSHARSVVALGIGAMLHDIGITQINDSVRERYDRLRDESDIAWRRHVLLGHHLVSGNIPASAAGVVRHHHQHFDGSGFPTQVDRNGRRRGLLGEEIHVFARIVCVANHFDRLHRAGDGSMQPRVRVLRQMLCSELTQRFDPVILAALPLVVPAYTPGSQVTLNTSERAIVQQWHPESPCQPTVLLIDDDDQSLRYRDLAPVLHDLRDEPELLIVEQDGCDVSGDNFRLLSPPVAA